MKLANLSALRTGCLSPQDITLVLISFRGWVDTSSTVRKEGLCQWRIPMAPSRIESSTFRLLAHCLNQLRHRCSHCFIRSRVWTLPLLCLTGGTKIFLYLFQARSLNCEKRLLAKYVRPSVRPRGTSRLPLDRFSWNSIFVDFFRKSVEKFHVLWKSDKHRWHFT